MFGAFMRTLDSGGLVLLDDHEIAHHSETHDRVNPLSSKRRAPRHHHRFQMAVSEIWYPRLNNFPVMPHWGPNLKHMDFWNIVTVTIAIRLL